MITDVTVSSFQSAQESGFAFVTTPQVGVFSVSADRGSVSLERALERCVTSFRGYLRAWRARVPQHAMYAFVATPGWVTMNAVLRRRGIWKQPNLGWAARGGIHSPDVEIADGKRARFAGVTLIRDDDLFDAANFVRVHNAGLLILSRDVRPDEQSVRNLFARAFPGKESRVDWSSLTASSAASDEIVVKVSGAFDDPGVAVDAFMSSELWRSIVGGHAEQDG